MPVHDWARVDDGTFHAFHLLWIGQLMGTLNRGILPRGYYAMGEQVATRMQTDLLALRVAPRPSSPIPPEEGGTAVAEAPPNVRLTLRPNPKTPARRPAPRRGRRLVIRHVSGDQVVAVLEIVSPSNKDRKAHVRDLAEKVVRSLESDVQVLLIDLLTPTRHDPDGLHGAIWSYFDATPYHPPGDAPLTLASYVWQGEEPRAFVEPVAVGQALIDMPLFLSRGRYVNVPLEGTYMSAYADMPERWRGVLEGAVP